MEEKRSVILLEIKLGVYDKYIQSFKNNPVLLLKASLASRAWAVSDTHRWHCPCPITLELQIPGGMTCTSFSSLWRVLLLKTRRAKAIKMSQKTPAERYLMVPGQHCAEYLTASSSSGDHGATTCSHPTLTIWTMSKVRGARDNFGHFLSRSAGSWLSTPFHKIAKTHE